MTSFVHIGGHDWSISDLLSDRAIGTTVCEIYRAAQANWRKSPQILSERLRATRSLHSRRRRVVHEALYGMIRLRRRLAWMIDRCEVDSGAVLDNAEQLYLAWLFSRSPEIEIFRTHLLRAGIHAERLLSAGEDLALVADPHKRMAIGQSFPTWLVLRFAGSYPMDRVEGILASLNQRAPLYARTNSLKISRPGLIARLAEEGITATEVADVPWAVEIHSQQNVAQWAAFQHGLFEVQDIGSQLISELVAPPADSVVFDLCAGAGGKTLALGNLLQNRGQLFAYDRDRRKLTELQKRAVRNGVNNIKIVSEAQINQLPSPDRLLLDVPCSGTGTLRRQPEARWRLQPNEISDLCRAQAELLERYAALVAQAGRIIYATCSLLREENDEIVTQFLRRHPEYATLPIAQLFARERTITSDDETFLRLSPDRQASDGFFAAVLMRKN